MRALSIDDPACAPQPRPMPMRSSSYRARKARSRARQGSAGRGGPADRTGDGLLRDVSIRRGRVLSRDFARTLTEAKWQSIVLGTAGVLIGIFAALLVVRRTVRPLASIATSIRAVAGGEKNASIPATDVDNEIGDIARAAEVFRQYAGRRRRRARGGGSRARRTAACRGKLSQAVRSPRSTEFTSRRPAARCSTPTRRWRG